MELGVRAIPLLASVPGERSVLIEHPAIEGARWRLWIPEVFIAERDNDRFLEMAGPDAQNYPISVQWTEKSGRLTYTWSNKGKGPVAFDYTVSVGAEDGAVDILFEVVNTGVTPWTKLFSAAVCVSNQDAPEFRDPDGGRTVLFRPGGPARVSDVVEALRSNPAVEWLGMDFYVGSRKDPSYQHWNVEHGLVVRESADRQWRVAFGWDTVARVDVVIGTKSMSCIHSHPEFEKLAAGDSVVRHGKIWFSRSSIEEILVQYVAFIAACK